VQTAIARTPPKAQPFVPLWGLVADGLIIAALVVAIVNASRYWLDFFHVFGGALWISTDILMGFVIGPIMNRLDIPARMVFAKNLMTKMLVIMPTAVICTVAAGWQLALIDGFFSYPYGPRHAWILAALIVVAILAVLAYTFLEPANIIVLIELRKPEPNGLLIGRMMRRFVYAAGVMQLVRFVCFDPAVHERYERELA
jgi:hypothetical protein